MRAFVVVGMGYGDEGKGTIVDYLARREGAGLVVRFNGGPQAGHNVVASNLLPNYVWQGIGLPHGAKIGSIHHEFRQFGSGTLQGARTHLSRYCVFNPEMIFLEADQLRKKSPVTEPLRLLSVDELAAVITPFHVAANRAREVARGSVRHGSCGMGIWETESDRRNPDVFTLLAADLKGMYEHQLRRELILQRERKRQEIASLVDSGAIPGGWANAVLRDLQSGVDIGLLAETYRIFGEIVEITDGVPDAEVIVFEGAQGILLDENLGFHPHTTGSTTTSANALALCEEIGCDDVQVIGVTRAYATRHGAGPFPTETDLNIPEPHNSHGQWQGGWRQGWTDLVALKYAADCDPNIQQVAVTHMDSVREACDVTWSVADTYDGLGWDKLPLVPKNRVQQERVGKFMANARPRYAQCDPAKVHVAIEDHLDLPVTITSEGPTYHDKRCPSLKI